MPYATAAANALTRPGDACAHPLKPWVLAADTTVNSPVRSVVVYAIANCLD